ncbi:serine/threonine protein kinase [Gemmata sp.]|uniref:serine/threonine protein kinase n=1 Tax=Gemmata sp. TaxID=1914242 RepID=UPI003F72C5A4
MGTPATRSDFTALVAQSNLIDVATLDQFLAKHSPAGELDEPPQLAAALVRHKLLTPFQAEQLLRGRWRGFFIGRYKVLAVLGVGGMGKVFLCEHPGMRRQVAIKVLPPRMAEDKDTVEAFYNEARALARLDHRNIVHAYDAAKDSGVHYLVLEYVKGRTLEDVVARDGPLGAHRAIDFLRQAALGLQHAFEAGLVHRDIKPSNFLVTDAGVVKILDLGLARFFTGPESGVGSKPDRVVGTLDYMAPEQALNTAEVDHRADIYSLGATFYYCLTGRPPFGSGTVAQKMLWHQMRTPEPIQKTRGDLPVQLTDIVEKMMAKAPDERFQTPDELLRALPSQDILTVEAPPAEQGALDTGLNLDAESPTLTVKQSRPDPVPVRAAGWKPSVGLVAGLCVALAVAAVAGLYFALRPAAPVRTADGEPPAPVRQAQAPVGRKVWLGELPEHDPSVGHGQFGKGGQLGFGNEAIVVNGQPSPHGLSMHPPANGSATVRYEIHLRAKLLTGTVAVNDTTGGQTPTPLVFVIRGDGAMKWESKPVRVREDAQPFQVDVGTVSRLELEVRCPGDHSHAHAVWLEPALTLK